MTKKHLNPSSKAFLDREIKEDLSPNQPEPPKYHFFGELPKGRVFSNTERKPRKYEFWTR